jgi:hypothetical protein
MLEEFFDNPMVVDRLRSGPLNPHLDSFAGSLAGMGYARATLQALVRLLSRSASTMPDSVNSAWNFTQPRPERRTSLNPFAAASSCDRHRLQSHSKTP